MGRRQRFTFLSNPWVKRVLWGLIIVIVLQQSAGFLARTLGKVIILEFLMALAPHESVNGVTILAFGIDETRAVQRSDALMLFHIDSGDNRIGVLSVPRDTRVQIEQRGMDKINHAYAFGGATLLKETVANFVGVPVDYYIQINLNGIETLIDDLGGLSLTVEKDLKYEDRAGGLNIDIQQGYQTLTGKQAVQYLRFRQDNEGDIGRIRRQQSFLQAAATKVTSMGTLFELPSVLGRLNNSFSTDMTGKQMMGLSLRFREAYKNGTISTGTVPGAIRLIEGTSYWKPDIEAMEKLLTKLILDTPEPVSSMAMDTPLPIKTPDIDASKETRRLITRKEAKRIIEVAEVTPDNTLALPDSMVVEVLNGIGRPGIAMLASKKLKSLEMRIFRFGNAGSFNYEKTLLVDWKGQTQKTLALAQHLGLPPENIIVYDRPEKPLDVTLVLGADWNTYFKETP